MFIRKSRKKPLANGSPLLHDDHGKPRTRREFIAQGLMAGSATVFGASLFSLFGNPRTASAALSSDLETLKASCGIAVQGAGKIPFICFDLAGGANIAGSNVLMGKSGCTLYTSAAADERSSGDLGGRSDTNKKKNTRRQSETKKR